MPKTGSADLAELKAAVAEYKALDPRKEWAKLDELADLYHYGYTPPHPEYSFGVIELHAVSRYLSDPSTALGLGDFICSDEAGVINEVMDDWTEVASALDRHLIKIASLSLKLGVTADIDGYVIQVSSTDDLSVEEARCGEIYYESGFSTEGSDDERYTPFTVVKMKRDWKPVWRRRKASRPGPGDDGLPVREGYVLDHLFERVIVIPD
jgi:hypothetical protein